MRASIVDLRYHMREVLGALERGETVIVLHRGKEKAKLTPVSSPVIGSRRDVRTMDEPLFGLWRDHKGAIDPDSYVSEVRQNRPLSIQSRTQKRAARKQRR